MINLYIWGAGGHGRVTLDCALAAGYQAAFLDDDPRTHGSASGQPPVFDPRAQLPQAAAEGASFIAAIGDNRARAACFAEALQQGVPARAVVHPAAVVSPSAAIGAGTLVMPGAVINSGARIGRNCIVNTGAIVEHDCRIGDHVHLAPRSTLGSRVEVRSFALIGIGASAIPGITIGEGAIVGAGAVVVEDVPPGVTAIGVPARFRVSK